MTTPDEAAIAKIYREFGFTPPTPTSPADEDADDFNEFQPLEVSAARKFQNIFAGRPVDTPRPQPTPSELKLQSFSKVWDAGVDIAKSRSQTQAELRAEFRKVWD